MSSWSIDDFDGTVPDDDDALGLEDKIKGYSGDHSPSSANGLDYLKSFEGRVSILINLPNSITKSKAHLIIPPRH